MILTEGDTVRAHVLYVLIGTAIIKGAISCIEGHRKPSRGRGVPKKLQKGARWLLAMVMVMVIVMTSAPK